MHTLPGLSYGQNLRKTMNVTHTYMSVRVSFLHSNYAYIIPHEEQNVVHRPMQNQVLFAFRLLLNLIYFIPAIYGSFKM